jgi:hypothetical protein
MFFEHVANFFLSEIIFLILSMGLDPDLHSSKKLNPDQHIMNADPNHCQYNNTGIGSLLLTGIQYAPKKKHRLEKKIRVHMELQRPFGMSQAHEI